MCLSSRLPYYMMLEDGVVCKASTPAINLDSTHVSHGVLDCNSRIVIILIYMGVVIIFCFEFQIQKYFLGLKKTMPSMSPVDKTWPVRSYQFLDGTHKELRRIFHLWRVSPKFMFKSFNDALSTLVSNAVIAQ